MVLSVFVITIVSQLSKCLKFVTFRGVILYRIHSFLSPRIDLNFRHLLSCETIARLLPIMKYHILHDFRTSTSTEKKCSIILKILIN